MDERVRATIEYLESTAFKAVSCRRLASRVGLSPSRLAHLFKDTTGQSIRSYVRNRRLTRAAELIVATDHRVSEILYAVGFTDFANFDHSFKRAFALSPGEYRLRWRIAGDGSRPAFPNAADDEAKISDMA